MPWKVSAQDWKQAVGNVAAATVQTLDVERSGYCKDAAICAAGSSGFEQQGICNVTAPGPMDCLSLIDRYVRSTNDARRVAGTELESGETDMDQHPPIAPPDPTNGSAHPIRQIERIIDDLATYATPVVREIAARAAELAAKAGQAAGPLAQRAADKTDVAGGRLAEKSRGIAADLRRETTGVDSSLADPSHPDLV